MADPIERRTPLRKAWDNLIIRTAAWYALLLGGAAALWRLFPDRMRALTRDLSGDLPALGWPVGRPGIEGAVSQAAVGPPWSSDMISAVVAMVVAGLFAVPVAWIYILVRQKKGFRQSLVHSLVLLPVVVAGVVVLVKNSLALAFSLAGIVAAVRFRNTLEDSKDAVYIFVATGIGLAAGVDLPVAVALSLMFNLVALLLWYTDLGRSSAALEGTRAARRLEQARAHVNRPSGFIEALDEEVLKGMSAEQLDALAARAWRRRRRHAPSRPIDGFESLLRLRATNLDAAKAAAEAVLNQMVKRWKLGVVTDAGQGTFIIEYGIQLRKSMIPAQLVEALDAAGEPAIVGVEVV
jgi:hypothetical protein